MQDLNKIALPPRWTPLRYHPQQWAAYHSQARFLGLEAGRRSGKTEICKRRLIRALRETKSHSLRPRYGFGAPTLRQARSIAWQDFKDLIPPQWIESPRKAFNETSMIITTIFGSTLELFGLNEAIRIEGSGFDGFAIDESCDVKPGTYGRSIRPLLSDRNGWCWRLGVPKRNGIGSKEFFKFCDRCHNGSYPGGEAYWWKSSDILTAAEIISVKEELDLKDFEEQYEATRVNAGGQVFHSFDEAYNVRPCGHDLDQPIIVCSDFNVDPMSWTLGHFYKSPDGNSKHDRIEFFDEIFLRNANTQSTLDVLHTCYGHHRGGFEFYGDASSKARRTSAGSGAAASDYLQILNDERFQKLGRTVHYPAANPRVVDRFSVCNAAFCNAAGKRKVFIDRRCEHLIDDLKLRGYKPGTREPNDSGDVGHMSDAMGYAVWQLLPIMLDNSVIETEPQVVIC